MCELSNESAMYCTIDDMCALVAHNCPLVLTKGHQISFDGQKCK